MKKDPRKGIHKALQDKLKYLRLQGLLTNWDEYLQVAAAKGLSHGRLL